jgi:hypothetical protein
MIGRVRVQVDIKARVLLSENKYVLVRSHSEAGQSSSSSHPAQDDAATATIQVAMLSQTHEFFTAVASGCCWAS